MSRQTLVIVLLLGIVDPNGIFADSPQTRTKKLIEFGWDEPDTAFMRRHLAQLEKSPFDGCVFHVVTNGQQGKQENFTWLGWGSRTFGAAELSASLDDLRSTPFQRFSENFLRFNATPAK